MQIIVNDGQLSLTMKTGEPAQADPKLPRVLPVPNSWTYNTHNKTTSFGNLPFANQKYVCKMIASQAAVYTVSTTIK